MTRFVKKQQHKVRLINFTGLLALVC